MPSVSPLTLSLKGLRSGEQEGIITPLQGDFNTLFCALIAPPFDPLLMNTLGTYHDQFVIGAGREGGRESVCVCVSVFLVFAEGMITLSGKKADNTVCSIVLSIRLELKVAEGEKNTLAPIW